MGNEFLELVRFQPTFQPFVRRLTLKNFCERHQLFKVQISFGPKVIFERNFPSYLQTRSNVSSVWIVVSTQGRSFRRPVSATSSRNQQESQRFRPEITGFRSRNTASVSGVRLSLVPAGNRKNQLSDTNIVFLLPFSDNFPSLPSETGPCAD